MGNSALGYACLVFGIANILNLIYFVWTSFRTNKKFFTTVNTQIGILIIGYISYYLLLGYSFLWYEKESMYFEDASIDVKITIGVGYYAIFLVQITLMYHSWLRAETILLYKNKLVYKVMDTYLKASLIFMGLLAIFRCVALGLRARSLLELSMTLVSLGGLIVFVFDIFMIYTFSNYVFFSEDQSVAKNVKYRYIAKYGLAAAICILMTTGLLFLATVYHSISNDISFVLRGCTFFFFQLPGFIFVALNRALKEDRGTTDNSNQKVKGLEISLITGSVAQ
jgi:hypothetical protein